VFPGTTHVTLVRRVDWLLIRSFIDMTNGRVLFKDTYVEFFFKSALTFSLPQLFSRYPVLKIHPTTARQMRKNPSVIARLTPTPTSDDS
jgi:hypothetical protein